ncbi:sensor domain-containing diguanylate cyclase [Vibrio rumoiensis]|uniref:diguanylate cyclase n=1 Tax=Vibrio rumoiensis 1S-45 TaxID=1188252 RepID=A0A1E5E1J0_9VIBR|nr:sensor domain-containing diguanylate cyclase [Vibrio rumoiensis]OEF25101.1 diguanylate cyclase [Vibrio rumoiensis 1S-45]
MKVIWYAMNKHLIAILTLILALSVTTLSVGFVYKSQKSLALTQLNNLANKHTDRLIELVQRDLQDIGAGANFYYSTNPSDWYQFNTFSKKLLSSSDSLVGLQWMEKVAVKDIPNHIQQTRKTFPNYQIYTVPKGEPKVEGYILKENKPIYVATDIFPRSQTNINILGFYSSRERFDRIIEHLVTHGEPNLSDKVRLLQDSLDRKTPKDGMLVYTPVFSQHEDHLLGVMIGVVRLSIYFEKLVSEINTENSLSIKIVDTGFDAEDDPILFESTDWESNQGDIIEKVAHLSNRNWIIQFKTKVAINKNNQWTLFSMAGAGAIISLLLTFIVSLLTREKIRLGRMLEERTSELRFLVEHDTLTGLHNRRAFNDRLSQLLNSKNAFSLVSFDIDKFKFINDQYGHPAGDSILQHVSYLVSQRLKEGDMFTRIGGDEFCIFTNVAEQTELNHYIEGIRQAVADSQYKMNGKVIRCTISIGASIWQGESSEELQHNVDLALYESKESGRNTATIFKR